MGAIDVSIGLQSSGGAAVARSTDAEIIDEVSGHSFGSISH